MKKVRDLVLDLLFPPKCIFCDQLLFGEEKEVCSLCSLGMEDFSSEEKLPYLHKWISLWYYEESIRESILRYKFAGASEYAPVYGRYLAEKIRERNLCEGEFVLTWVPVSRQRKRKRGYDQVELLAEAVGKELGVQPVCTLRKIRNTPAQSGISDPAKRRANVLGAYAPVDPQIYKGKRILLLDDIVTTGATAGECAKVLLTAGAGNVDLAVLAASR